MLIRQSRNRTLVFCVIYPGLSDSIVLDYVSSIANQTDKEFDWLIIADNSGNGQRHLFPQSAKWINLDTELSFGQIRAIGISFAVENDYIYIVFSDIDDFYSENRVEVSKTYLGKCDFVFSELQIVDMERNIVHKNYLSRLHVNSSPNKIQEILDHNYIGLSHSAVRTSALRNFAVSSSIEVVDWWLFSLLLINGHSGIFLPDVDTFYRQGSDNYVGVYNLLDDRRLRRGVDAKLNHYGQLMQYCLDRNNPEKADMFRKKHEEMVELSSLLRDELFAQRYIEIVNANYEKLYKGWWSEILPLEKWKQYDK